MEHLKLHTSVRRFIDGMSMSKVDFVDWLDPHYTDRIVFVLSSLFCLLVSFVYTMCALMRFSVRCFNNIFACL